MLKLFMILAFIAGSLTAQEKLSVRGNATVRECGQYRIVYQPKDMPLGISTFQNIAIDTVGKVLDYNKTRLGTATIFVFQRVDDKWSLVGTPYDGLFSDEPCDAAVKAVKP